MEATPFDLRADERWPPRKDLVFLYRANPLRFAYFDRLVPDWHGVEVLDLGCGGGYTCEYLAGRGATVSGADISEPSLIEARRHAAQSDLTVKYLACTPSRLPFDSRPFDVVTCFDVIEHVDDLETTLSEILRVLKPGGRLMFDTINQTFWARLALLWLGERILRKFPRGTHEWQRFVTPEKMRHRLQAAGFVEIEFAGLRHQRYPRVPDALPFAVTPDGNTAIMYFGSARKASDPAGQRTALAWGDSQDSERS